MAAIDYAAEIRLGHAQPIGETATDEEVLSRRRFAARRSAWLWSTGEPCRRCGEWVGHFGGSAARDPCPLIPLNVPLVEVRPNCNDVHRPRIGDAIRAACEKANA